MKSLPTLILLVAVIELVVGDPLPPIYNPVGYPYSKPSYKPVYRVPAYKTPYPPSPSYSVYNPRYRPEYRPDYKPTPSSYSPPVYPKYEDGPAPYNFDYAVKDQEWYNDYSHKETSDDKGNVAGSYRTLLPDGRTQVVNYKADDNTGFVADVVYEGQPKPAYKPKPSYAPEYKPKPYPPTYYPPYPVYPGSKYPPKYLY